MKYFRDEHIHRTTARNASFRFPHRVTLNGGLYPIAWCAKNCPFELASTKKSTQRNDYEWDNNVQAKNKYIDQPKQVVMGGGKSTIEESYMPQYPRLKTYEENVYNAYPFIIGTMRLIGATDWT